MRPRDSRRGAARPCADSADADARTTSKRPHSHPKEPPLRDSGPRVYRFRGPLPSWLRDDDLFLMDEGCESND